MKRWGEEWGYGQRIYSMSFKMLAQVINEPQHATERKDVNTKVQHRNNAAFFLCNFLNTTIFDEIIISKY